MKTYLLIPTLLAVIASTPLRAQTDAARELKQLLEQREAAAAAALAPVNKRHVDALTQLLTRATRNGDLDTAVKTRSELEKYGVKVAAAGLTTTAVPGLGESKKAILRAQLKDSIWNMSDGKTITCHADGSTTASWHAKKGEWKVSGANTAEISYSNSLKLRQATFDADYKRAVIVGEGVTETMTRLAK